MRKKQSLVLVITLVLYMSLYSYVYILTQSPSDKTEVVMGYDIQQENGVNSEMTLVRIILNGIEYVFKVF